MPWHFNQATKMWCRIDFCLGLCIKRLFLIASFVIYLVIYIWMNVNMSMVDYAWRRKTAKTLIQDIFANRLTFFSSSFLEKKETHFCRLFQQSIAFELMFYHPFFTHLYRGIDRFWRFDSLINVAPNSFMIIYLCYVFSIYILSFQNQTSEAMS